ncbi:hypothetical protein J1N35_022147 [Gossypium stocksii]|uniref:Retrovirus-related Pol polyprotein from transposon TNT 1-94-like beta-barrel domain-containing protein n=1 Tax=Gossypium stocksii TaxID=47602 RepID=A0A9D4A0V3_9ROSI|nr:hypothetical protein J1N35_022147 [Gossypium stocksii]
MEKTSSALWKMLETLYATKSLANHLVLKQRLFTFRVNEGELLRYRISQFITLLNELKSVEVHIDDEDQAMLLLCSLPPSYKSFKETLIYGRDKLSFEDVKGHLLCRDKLDNELHLDSKADRQASILVASKKRDKMCRYSGPNLADENDDDFLLVSTSYNSKLTSEWILDFGCSFNMCPIREWFFTYSSVEGGVVRMGNDSFSKVIGIGTVKIKIYDGTIRALLNVSLYILEGSTVTGEIGRPRPLRNRSQLVWSIGNLVIGGKKCISRRLEVFQILSVDSTQLIPYLVQDRLVASFGKDGVVVGELRWITRGDFNVTLSPFERSSFNGTQDSSSDIREFQDFVNSLDVVDLGHVGPSYTWSNLQ